MSSRGSRSRHRRRDHTGRQNAALVALAVMVLALCAFAVKSTSETPQQAATPLPTLTPSPSATAKVKTLAFLGDSWSAGAGAQPGAGFVYQTADALGMRLAQFGEGGTGYTNNGRGPAGGEDSYPERVPAVVAAHPDVVVVQGSTNDHSPALVPAAAARTFRELRAGLPSARIVVVGPMLTPGTPAGEVSADLAAIRDAAKAQGLTFIDPAGWLAVGDHALWFDQFHPSQAGHDLIAKRLSAALKRAA